MGNFKLVYSKGLKRDDVKVREFETEAAVDEWLGTNPDDYKEYMIFKKGKTDQDGTIHYRILNRGTFRFIKILAYVVSITVMVAVITGLILFRNWLIHFNK